MKSALWCLALIITICLVSSACSTGYNPYEVGEKVLFCFDNDDAKTLKSLFCKETLSSVDNLDEQIEEAFEFYEGKSVDVGSIRYSSEKSVRDGKIVWLTENPIIHVYATTIGKEYTISVSLCIVNESFADRVGITHINVCAPNEDGIMEIINEIG